LQRKAGCGLPATGLPPPARKSRLLLMRKLLLLYVPERLPVNKRRLRLPALFSPADSCLRFVLPGGSGGLRASGLM